jgi:hypothetical protein
MVSISLGAIRQITTIFDGVRKRPFRGNAGGSTLHERVEFAIVTKRLFDSIYRLG